MHLDIHARNIPLTLRLKEHAARRLEHALGRLAHRITRVTLRLADVNGPKGGVDVEALAVVEMANGTPVVVKGLYASPDDAIGAILERVRTAVARCQDRVVRTFRGR